MDGISTLRHYQQHIAKLKGASTLVLTSILLFSMTLIVLFAANYSIFQQKIAANVTRGTQAFEAAQAGLEYGIVYLTQNFTTIEASATSGLINYSLSKATLSNNSSYTVSFTNPTANNYTIFLIQSTGLSDDGTATRTVQQYVSEIPPFPTNSLISSGSVLLSGAASSFTNTVTNSNIQSGSTVTLSSGAKTYTSSGLTSSVGSLGSDIQQNASSIHGISESSFFTSVFGISKTAQQAKMATVYNNTMANGNYSLLLSGTTNSSVWINQTNGSTVTINGGVTVGSATAPLLLIVEGANVVITNGVTFNGYVYASNTFMLSGSILNGGFSTAQTATIFNNATVNYKTFPGINIGNPVFARVPGSWRDF